MVYHGETRAINFAWSLFLLPLVGMMNRNVVDGLIRLGGRFGIV